MDEKIGIITIGIDENIESTKKVYVSNNKLYIEGFKAGEEYQIYTSTGQLIRSEKIHNEIQELNINNGIFIINIGKSRYKIIN